MHYGICVKNVNRTRTCLSNTNMFANTNMLAKKNNMLRTVVRSARKAQERLLMRKACLEGFAQKALRKARLI